MNDIVTPLRGRYRRLTPSGKYPFVEYRGGSCLRRHCVVNGVWVAPVPGHQLIDLLGGMTGDAGEDVGQPGLGIDVVELGGDDEAVHEGGTVAAAIGAGE